MINQDNSKGRERTKEGRDYFKNKTLKLKEGQRISRAEKHESTHAHTHTGNRREMKQDHKDEAKDYKRNQGSLQRL